MSVTLYNKIYENRKNDFMKKNEKIFIDFEMDTNCDSKPEQIIEIGAVKVDNNNKIISKFCKKIKLINKNRLYEYTTFLTGITDEELLHADEFSNVLNDFVNWCEGCERIYNWGNCDKISLIKTFKKIPHPEKKAFKNYTFLLKNMLDCREIIPKKHRKYYSMNLFKIAIDLHLINENNVQTHSSVEDAIVLKKIYTEIINK